MRMVKCPTLRTSGTSRAFPPATVLARIVIVSPACVAIHGLSGFQEKAPQYRAKAAVPGNERIGGRMSHASHPRRYGHEQDGVY
ncbi:protein of unknown function [Candidatus Nitrospira inopinata]|uniref:Uncharacterized protein n=1 Tax=Candidatus Nitrospira inopinata TaxID=1715989 RepID=A0A0S4KP76_9BACT|nr:protein of unknown function [Candidatus Nitrospira inopinata]